jgi:hypothetical protein
MATHLYRASVFALYQFSIVLGIVFLPVALVANRAGISLPIGRLVERFETAHRRASER